LPAIGDAFCPSCRNAIDDEPIGRVHKATTTVAASRATRESDSGRSGNAGKYSADWGFGLLAGTLFGMAAAMIWIEPYWITPDSKVRLYVAAAGVLGASGVCMVRNWFHRKGKSIGN